MGRELKRASGAFVSWSNYESYPLISVTQCVDGSWFGSVSFSVRAVSLSVHGRPTLRAALVAMRKLVRAVKNEVDTLKQKTPPARQS